MSQLSLKHHRLAAFHLSILITVLSAGYPMEAQAVPAALTWAQDASQQSMQMPLVAPLVEQREGIQNTLTIIGGADVAFPVLVMVRDKNGSPVNTVMVTAPANLNVEVDITQLVTRGTNHGDRFVGSLLISSTDPHFASLAAQLSIRTIDGSGKSIFIEEELLMLTSTTSTEFRSTKAHVAGPVALSLTSLSESATQLVTISCVFEHRSPSRTMLSLLPGHTTEIDSCTDGPGGQTEEMSVFSVPTTSARSTPLGISVSTSGMPGELGVFGIATTVSFAQVGYSSMNFHQTAATFSSSAVFTGVPVGTTKPLGNLFFTPMAAITNFGNAAVNVSFDYSTIVDGRPASTRIYTGTVPALTSRPMVLPISTSDPSFRNSFLITSNGTPGQVYTDLGALSREDPSFSVDGIAKDRNQRENGGEHPWRADRGYHSFLLLYNPAKEQSETVNIVYVGKLAQHEKQIVLQPQQTEALNIQDVFESVESHSDVVTTNDAGTVYWTGSGPAAVFGRVVQVDQAEHVSRNFSCGTKTVLCGVTIDSNPLELTVGSSASTYGHYKGCSVPTMSTSCSGSTTTSSANANSWTWTVANSSIASIQGSNTTGTGTFSGVSNGTTTVGLSARDGNGCSANGSGQIVVGSGCPTSITLAELETIYLGTYFPTDKTGEGAAAAMQANPTTTNFSGVPIKEDVSGTSTSCQTMVFGAGCGTQLATFTINTNGSYKGTIYTPINNDSFWDFHYHYDPNSLLDETSPLQSNCQEVCAQTYSCNGAVIGRFTITRTYTHGTLSGQNVTNVGVTKQ